jgi:sugar/nucleoside kinase (ribokinase family)
VIATVGDVVEDVVVRLSGPVHEATDTAADVVRRRGGSAANMAVSVARSGHAARFIGQVGDDAAGAALIADLEREGVDVIARRSGRTGTIVVILDHLGERSMLTDRGAATGLDHPERRWLDEVTTLHVPLYSLVGEPIARTTATLVSWAHELGIVVSLDTSSASVIDDLGGDAVTELLMDLRPTVLLCNEMEANALDGQVDPLLFGGRLTVIKRGARPAVVMPAERAAIEVPALAIDNVRDTTGAGDAFAAGLLVALEGGSSPVAAAMLGHQSAARAITAASAG